MSVFGPIGTLAGLAFHSLFVGMKMSKHFSTNLYKTTGGCSINHFWTDALIIMAISVGLPTPEGGKSLAGLVIICSST